MGCDLTDGSGWGGVALGVGLVRGFGVAKPQHIAGCQHSCMMCSPSQRRCFIILPGEAAMKPFCTASLMMADTRCCSLDTAQSKGVLPPCKGDKQAQEDYKACTHLA